MPEPTRAELKERITRVFRRNRKETPGESADRLDIGKLECDTEIDALREANRSLTMQLWEIRHVVAAYRAFHVQDSEATEEE